MSGFTIVLCRHTYLAVGMLQALLDSALIYFSKDLSIDVPLIGDTIKLHSKFKQLGFEAVVIIQYKVN